MAAGLSTALFSRAPQGSVRTRRPRLLVSVRNVDEALAALAGGADIIDVKEPLRGALGMADAAVISGIVAAVGRRAPVSAALGELREWTVDARLSLMVDGLSKALPDLSFVKLGLAGYGRQRSWQDDWLAVRQQVESHAGQPLPWVAVAYVDVARAGAPETGAIIDAAISTGCCGVLLDTYDKQCAALPACCTAAELRAHADVLQAAGLFLAVAGRLNRGDVGRSELSCADVIGVRSAACTGSDRQQSITADRVSALKSLIVQGRSSPDGSTPVHPPSTIDHPLSAIRRRPSAIASPPVRR